MEILTNIMPIIVVAILGFGAFWGFIRKLNKTLFRFVFLLLAMGGALVLAKMLSGTVSGYVFEALKSAEIEIIDGFLQREETVELAKALCSVLTAPVLFVVFYVVLKPISWIPYKIVIALFRVKGPRFLGRITGAVAGLLCGLVGLVVFVTPVFGYLNLVDATLEQLLDEEDVPEALTVITDITQSSPIAAKAYDVVGKPLFSILTTTELEGEEFNLENEVEAVVVVLKDAGVLLEKSPEEYGEAEVAAMEKLSHDVADSHILSSVLSSFLSEASTSWLNGEDMMGISKPDMGADMGDIMDAFLEVFSTSDSQNIEQDLGTFAGVFRIFVENEMLALLSGEGQTANFVEKLVSGGIVTDLYATLDANTRMAPVKAAIIDTGMRVMLEQLGVSSELKENHGELMENIVGVVQDVVKDDGTLDVPALKTGLQETLRESDIEVSDEVAQIVADGMADIYTTEELENLTTDELVDKLIERFAGAELPEGVTI
ncbi:MAG: hypothetical protein J6U87_04720, partial [Clostridia bacterium]|nr:hypothetical protein [Clostridia bacterium]